MGSDAQLNAETSACVRCYVEGRVQGVFFRSSTRQQALSLGITGFARNLSDGRVEVYACGDHRALETLRSWLVRGPEHARVTSVQCKAAEPEPYLDFTIL